MRGLGVAIAVVLAALALSGCGGAGRSERQRGQFEERAIELGFRGFQEKTFIRAGQFCGRKPKSEFPDALAQGLAPDPSDSEIARAYAREWAPQIKRAVYEGCMAGLLTVPARPPESSPLARALWGRDFIATKVSSQRVKHLPVHPPPYIRVAFSGEREHQVYWEAGCNSFGGSVHISAARLVGEDFGGTLVGCGNAAENQDDWLTAVMTSRPEWHLEGTRLELVSGRGTIDLKGFEDPDSCPVLPSEGRIDLGNTRLPCSEAVSLLALYAASKNRNSGGWLCHGDAHAGTDNQVTCRARKWRFIAEGFDLSSLRASERRR